MLKTFGLFINLNYAHKPWDECSLIWQMIMKKMLENGFTFQKRTFQILTEKNSDELSATVRQLFEEIQRDKHNLYSYLVDCYILNIENCNDLTLPDTSDSIDVEHINVQDLKAAGVKYELLFKK